MMLISLPPLRSASRFAAAAAILLAFATAAQAGTGYELRLRYQP
jgi:hypothetical protein